MPTIRFHIFNLLIYVFAVYALIGGVSLANENTLSSDENLKHYKIGVSFLNHYPLFDFGNSEDKGASWSILEAFAQKYGYRFEYIALPPVRLQGALNRGEIDFIFPDNPDWTAYRPNKDANVYSISIMEAVGASFVASYNRDLKESDIQSVSIPYGYTAISWMQILERYNIDTLAARDLEMALHTLKTGDATAADVEYNVGRYLIENNPSLSNLVINTNLPKATSSYHLSTRKHILVLEQISQFSIEHAELISMLKETYGIKSYEQIFGQQQPQY
ncbi:hypothetical protein PN836_013500 [Ningiella sp. W23]|uniref:hypothetical protein n=1 Tax=Ningiella sp. W23 TaxID=3023715 RepID=UPI003757874D